MTSFINTFSWTNKLIAAAGQTSTAKTAVLIGSRVTNGNLVLAETGYDNPELYKPIFLQSYTDGASALSYLKNLGLRVAYGITFSLNLPAPDLVTINSDSTVTLQFDVVPTNFIALTGSTISGTITQDTDTGTVVSAIISSNKAYLTVRPISSSTFNTTDDITLSGVNNNSYPDPSRTDDIAMKVWYYYQSAVSLPTSPIAQPNCYISILSSRDTTISPNPSTFTLAAPTDVDVNGTNVTLTYAAAVTNMGYMPFTALGDTTLTQATSNATGTFVSMTPSNGTITIQLSNVDGTFNTTNTLAVALDSTQNVFQYLQNIEINNVVFPYEISASNPISNYIDFTTGIAILNNGLHITDNKFLVQGIWGNCSTMPQQVLNLPVQNNQLYKQVSYPYTNQFLERTFSGPYLAAAQAYVDNNVDGPGGNNNIPFGPQDGVYLSHIPVTSNKSIYYNTLPGGTADQAMGQGWLPWAVNANGVAYIVRDLTSLTTIPNTTITDVEFRFQRVWDVVRYITKDIYDLWQIASVSPTLNGGRVLNSSYFQAGFRRQIQGRLSYYDAVGLTENSKLYSSLVQVVTDPLSPTGINVSIPCQIIPGLGSANVTLNIFSANTNIFTINQAA